MILSPEKAELLGFTERKIAIVDRIINSNEILVPKSDEQDAKMKGLVQTHVSDIKVYGIENLRIAVRAADEAGVVLTTVRNHQTYFDIATARAAFESEGEKDFADAQVFPAGLEIYELYRDTHFPANETSVMVVAPQDAWLINQGLEGAFGELTTDQRILLEACRQRFTNLIRRSLPVMVKQVALTRRLTLFPETEFPPFDGLTQRPKAETSIYFKKPGINLPIRQDGPHLIYGPDTEPSDNKPNTFVLEIRIGKHFTNNQLAAALADVSEAQRVAENIAEVDIAFKPVVDIRIDRIDSKLQPFFAGLPSVYNYAT